MFKGGIADKLGNRYEAKWLVRQFLDVISNQASWIRFEGITPEYQGFEFAIERESIIEWHQTKINAPNGNWTLRALEKEGVLEAFKNRLESSENTKCLFVSQDGVKDLRTLISKALISNTPEEYVGGLSQEQKNKFKYLQEIWRRGEEQTYDWLNRLEVITFPDNEIEQLISSRGDLYFEGGRDNTFSELRDYLEKNFNKEITPEIARKTIKAETNLLFKDWIIDSTIQEKIKKETQAYLDTYSPFGAGGSTIPRSQIKSIIDELHSSKGTELILLTGVAGSGKSGVTRGVIQELEKHKITHLAFRVDHHLSCNSPQDFGNELFQRNESPVITLKGIEPKKTSVLIIDQVDAISEVSGRDGAVKEAILRMVKDASYFQTVKVIIVCRTFDLQSDSRLKQLDNKERTKKIDTPLLDWDKEVSPLLELKKIDVSKLSVLQRKILCLPVNLAIFFELKTSNFSFHAQSDLFKRLLDQKERSLRQKTNVSWSLLSPLSKIANWMSDHQKLNTPETILDEFQSASDLLTTEGLIICSQGQINLFHESLFDYLYARSFINSSQSLIELLNSSEQHLFRRTQTRQILESLRQNNLEKYFNELKNIMSDTSIRYHIKSAVAQWLGSLVNPTQQEFEIISKKDTSSKPFDPLISKALLSSAGWFDLLSESGWVQKNLDSNIEERQDLIFWWLADIAGECPKEIIKTLRAWWGIDPKKAERLSQWFGTIRRKKPDDELLSFCKEIILSNPPNLFHKASAYDRTMMLARTWGEEKPEQGAEIIKALFDVWYETHPDKHPFNKDELKEFDIHTLIDISQKSPKSFLVGTTDAFIKAVQIVNAKSDDKMDQCHFKHRSIHHRFGVDQFIGIYQGALCKLAKSHPNEAQFFLSQLNPKIHETILHFHLEAISANGEALANNLIPLLDIPEIFEPGWSGADWKSFADATKSALPFLDKQKRNQVETTVLSNNEEIDRAKRITHQINKEGEQEPYDTKKRVIQILNYSGYTQWCILETIGEKHLSSNMQQYLYQLQRKFPNKKIESPNDYGMHGVAPPIKKESTKKMSDNNWLKAIEKYDGKEDKYRQNRHIGGAHSLANELQTVAKEEPRRFVRLLKLIPNNAHHSYIERLLSGLSESEFINNKSIRAAILNAHQRPNKPYGHDICMLIRKFPKATKAQEIFSVLQWYIENGTAEETSEETTDESGNKEISTINDLVDGDFHFHIIGNNGVRGLAMETLAKVLWELPNYSDKAWTIIKNRINTESVVGVRCSIIYPLSPLYNNDKVKCGKYLLQLATKNIVTDANKKTYPLIAHQGVDLLRYILHWVPEVSRKLIDTHLSSSDKTIQLIGAWHVFNLSFDIGEYADLSVALLEKSVEHRRLMADVAANALHHQECRNHAEELLIRFFDDEDKEVRRLASHAFSDIKPDNFHKFFYLSQRYLDSKAFCGRSTSFLIALEKATCDVLDLVLSATEKNIQLISKDGDNGNTYGSNMHRLQKLLKYEYSASEGNPDARKRILDIIDLLLPLNIYGGENIANIQDR